jgi:TRAP-type uncharacterized transport system substrate-binding protein
MRPRGPAAHLSGATGVAGIAEAEGLLQRFLDFLQSDRRIRVGLGLLVVGAMLALAGRSLYRIIPRHYALSITGGDIVSNRHFLARILQEQAARKDLTLVVEPISAGLDALERVSQGKLDLAFVQGGIEQTYPNVEHVATVMPELVHLLVKPGLGSIDDLKGRSINMEAKGSPSRSVAQTLLRFAGYSENIDYVETNFTAEQLLGLPFRKMPDAILTVSSVPSYLIEILVRKHKYQVVEIPFPESLALRHGWAANGTILAYTYDLAPPVPAKNLQTIAVNLHLVAHAGTEPEAISRLLEVLYSPAVSNRLLQPIDEKRLTIPSGFPMSEGVNTYLHRNDAFFTLDLWNRLQGLFGLAMSFLGTGLVVLRWFRGREPEPVYDDAEFLGHLAEVEAMERRLLGHLAVTGARGPQAPELRAMRLRLGELRVQLLERFPRARLRDGSLFDRCLAVVRAAQEQVVDLLRELERAR